MKGEISRRARNVADQTKGSINREQSSSTIFDIDPNQEGPQEVARRIWRSIKSNWKVLGGASLLVILVYWFLNARYGWSRPTAPVWLWVLALSSIAGILISLYPLAKVSSWLWNNESVTLLELDPVTGDYALWELPPSQFRSMTVVDHKDEERDRSFLHEITGLSGSRGYEVDHYDPEKNLARASWMAGARNREIRKHQRAVAYIKRELSIEADKSLDALVNAPQIVRAQGTTVANTLIRMIEGQVTPGDGNTIHEQLFAEIESADITGDLLEDSMQESSIEERIKAFSESQDEGEDESDLNRQAERELAKLRNGGSS